ncbi:amidohydrolase [Pseudactinotalea sp. Z1748]|uniref:amidohydrolase n=1 Tax=Pseudactinotalea sp. Z1748 TaxID=3413027 RepID=UPI003C7C07E9
MTTIAFTGGHVLPIDADPFDGTVVVTDGVITAIGPKAKVPRGAEVIDATGQWVLPGFVDAHTHLGTHEEAEGWAGSDVNEMTDPVTAQVRALDAINPRETGFADALAGGVTAVCVNPGSGNVVGGLCVAIHTHGEVVDEMLLRSPAGLKSALGENPKRVYGDKKTMPSTRLGTAAVLRQAFVEAQNYVAKRDGAKGDFDGRDLKHEAVASVLAREIPWRQHAHRSDDIATALRVAEEFGYELVLDHGTEAHLVAKQIAQRGVPVLIGPLFTSRSKVELRERSLTNPAKLARAGVEISIITDHPVVPINFLVHQATLAVKEGLDRDTALRAITLNPAKVIGIDDKVGSLAKGKYGDIVLWSGDPLDVMQRAQRVFIKGQEVYAYTADEA